MLAIDVQSCNTDLSRAQQAWPRPGSDEVGECHSRNGSLSQSFGFQTKITVHNVIVWKILKTTNKSNTILQFETCIICRYVLICVV